MMGRVGGPGGNGREENLDVFLEVIALVRRRRETMTAVAVVQTCREDI